jgi:hypothetical protein
VGVSRLTDPCDADLAETPQETSEGLVSAEDLLDPSSFLSAELPSEVSTEDNVVEIPSSAAFLLGDFGAASLSAATADPQSLP